MHYVFGDYRLDTQQYALYHADVTIKLRPKVFQLLMYLITHRDRVVSKQELSAALWADQFVSEATLDSCLAEARQAVGDSGRSQRVIQTRYGHGYRFVAPVEIQSELLTSPEDVWSPAPMPDTVEETVSGPPSTTAMPVSTSDTPPQPHALGPAHLSSLWALAGEHKVVTVLVCTLVHPPLGTSRRAAEAWHQVRQTLITLMQEEVARYEGTLQGVLEDSMLVLFGAPVAQEDHAQRAVQAALGLRDRLRAVHLDPAWLPGEVGAVRMGLHTGPLVIARLHGDRRLDYTAVGDTTSLAVQLSHGVPPGRIAISAATQTRVAGLFQMRTLDVHLLPGQGEPLRAFEVLRARGRRTRWEVVAERGLTPHVGRVRERALLVELFQQVKGGHGQVVCVAGEAGIGKSRHLFEFRRALADAGEAVTWLEGRCLSFGQTIPLLPVVDQLREAFGIEHTDDAAAIRAKVDEGVCRLGALDAHLPALRYLLAVDPGDPALGYLEPAARRTRLFEAIVALALRGAQRRPLILVYEDLHWSDTSTATLLGTLIDAVAGVPLLVLLTYRVGYTPPFESRSFLTTLTLRRLSEAQTLAMARAQLGTPALPAALEALLLEQTAGVPLFVEEVLKTLLDLGALQRDAGTYRLRHGLAEVGVPDTIQGIIAARLDRLSEAGKHTVQLASVLGRQFPVRLLAELVEMPGPLDDLLRELQAREIIERRGLVPEPTYGFTHAVIQEVAYNSLLLRQRQAIHQAVGAAMEAWYPERLAEHAAEVAHHFLAGERWPKAMAYSTLAGDRAAEAYANAEAAAHYARAVHAAAQCAPPPEAGLVARLHAKHGAVLMVLAAYDEAVAAYQRALALMQEIGDQRGEIEILLGLSTVYTNTHSFGAAPAVDTIAHALAVARALHDRALQAVCLASQVRVRTRGYGQLREAMADAEEAVHLARETQNPKLLAETLVALGRVLQWQGAFARGRTALQEGATLAQQAHAGFLSGMALFFLGNTATAQGAYDEAVQWYQQLHDYAATAVDRYWIARVPNTIGGLHLELFDLDTALELTLEGDEVAQQGTGWSEVRGHALVKAGLAYLLRGEHGRAEACFRRADALLETDIWMRWRWHIVLLRGWGELALAQGRYDDAWNVCPAVAGSGHPDGLAEARSARPRVPRRGAGRARPVRRGGARVGGLYPSGGTAPDATGAVDGLCSARAGLRPARAGCGGRTRLSPGDPDPGRARSAITDPTPTSGVAQRGARTGGVYGCRVQSATGELRVHQPWRTLRRRRLPDGPHPACSFCSRTGAVGLMWRGSSHVAVPHDTIILSVEIPRGRACRSHVSGTCATSMASCRVSGRSSRAS